MKQKKRIPLRRALCFLAVTAALGLSACSAAGGTAQAGTQATTGTAETASGETPAPTPAPTDAKVSSAPTDAKIPSAPIVTDNDLPDLSVTYSVGGEQVSIPSCSGGYTAFVPQPDGTTASVVACGADPFWTLMESDPSIPYLETGSVITLAFHDGIRPDSITMTDLLLREDGSALYSERSSAVTELKPEGETLSFPLEKNVSACLSSSIQPAGFYHGFRLDCSWDCGSKAEYAFIIRSDAIPGPDGQNVPQP